MRRMRRKGQEYANVADACKGQMGRMQLLMEEESGERAQAVREVVEERTVKEEPKEDKPRTRSKQARVSMADTETRQYIKTEEENPDRRRRNSAGKYGSSSFILWRKQRQWYSGQGRRSRSCQQRSGGAASLAQSCFRASEGLCVGSYKQAQEDLSLPGGRVTRPGEPADRPDRRSDAALFRYLMNRENTVRKGILVVRMVEGGLGMGRSGTKVPGTFYVPAPDLEGCGYGGGDDEVSTIQGKGVAPGEGCFRRSIRLGRGKVRCLDLCGKSRANALSIEKAEWGKGNVYVLNPEERLTMEDISFEYPPREKEGSCWKEDIDDSGADMTGESAVTTIREDARRAVRGDRRGRSGEETRCGSVTARFRPAWDMDQKPGNHAEDRRGSTMHAMPQDRIFRSSWYPAYKCDAEHI